MKLILMASAIALGLGGCTTQLPQSGDPPVKPLVGPVVTRADTPMDRALSCLAENMPETLDIRIGVADVTDGTGATVDGDTLSRILTQRPDLMLVVALSKAGVRLVNRSSTSVAEWEMKQALEKRLGDGKRAQIGQTSVNFRPVPAGGLLGSTHYVVGALTEVNWNVDSAVAEAGFYGFNAGTRGYYISIGFDLLVTNTKTTEISMARAYNKQIFGRESKAGIYRFFDFGGSSPNFGPLELFRANVGQKKNEPVQTAVRWVMETAAYDMVRNLTGAGELCDVLLPNATSIYDENTPIVETSVQAEPSGSSENIQPPAGSRSPEVPPLRPPQETPYMVPIWPSNANESETPVGKGFETQEASAGKPTEGPQPDKNNIAALPEPQKSSGQKVTQENKDDVTGETNSMHERLKVAGVGSGFGFPGGPQ